MGLVSSKRTLSKDTIKCGEDLKVKLTLNVVPDITTNPADFSLVLDRSGSMVGDNLANLEKGAKEFIRIVEKNSDPVTPGTIGGGTKIAIVTFNDTAVIRTPLTNDVATLNKHIEQMVAERLTNHYDAFQKGIETLSASKKQDKYIILFTDGLSTAGTDATVMAEQAKAQGIKVYCIGLGTQVDVAALNKWASSPADSYVSIAPTAQDVEEIFKSLANNITHPGATNIRIADTINDCFKVKTVLTPTKGIAAKVDNQSVEWTITELGTSTPETAELEYVVEHNGVCEGNIPVNDVIIYTDDQKNTASFKNLNVDVTCPVVIDPTICPDGVDVTVPKCETSYTVNVGDTLIDNNGVILNVNAILKDVCPNKNIAVAVVVDELDALGKAYPRGMKVVNVPGHNAATCNDVLIENICFVIPENIDFTNPTCEDRKFNVKVISNYIGHDYKCTTN